MHTVNYLTLVLEVGSLTTLHFPMDLFVNGHISMFGTRRLVLGKHKVRALDNGLNLICLLASRGDGDGN